MIKPYSNFETGNIYFDIEGDNLCYLDLSQTELIITAKVVNHAGAELDTIGHIAGETGLVSTDPNYATRILKRFCGPVNNFFHSRNLILINKRRDCFIFCESLLCEIFKE